MAIDGSALAVVAGPPLLFLLHGSGLDELLMIVVGLVIAYVVIHFSGRKRDGEGKGDADESTE